MDLDSGAEGGRERCYIGMRMHFFIVRHAETDWNKEQRLQGQTDIPLNQNGLMQAAELAKQMLNTGITHVLTSDLVRAYETGRVVAEHLNLPLICDSRLRECHFGSLEGLTRQEIVERYGEAFIASVNCAYDFGSVGGERHDQVLQRTLDALSDFYEKHAEAIPLIVSHGRIMRTLFEPQELNKIPPIGTCIKVEFESRTPFDLNTHFSDVRVLNG